MANDEARLEYQILDSTSLRALLANLKDVRVILGGCDRKIGTSARLAMGILISYSSSRDRTGSVCVKQACRMFAPQDRRGPCRLNGHFSRIPTTQP